MKTLSEQERRIIDVLQYDGNLPSTPYIIDEEKILQYMHAYVHVLKKTPFKLDTAAYRYSRKLAGLTLIKHNLAMGVDKSSIRAGFVYLVENPAFPEHYKVGMCLDVVNRLATYQTYDPHRAFKLARSEFVLDRRHTEKQILSSFKISLENGEWIKRRNAENIFKQCSHTYKKVLATSS
jgi:hypothetical protein